MEPPKSPGGLCVTIDAQDPSSEHPQSSDAEVEQADHGPYLMQPSISAGCLPLLTLIALGWIAWQWITWPDVKDLVVSTPVENCAFVAGEN